MNQYGTGVYLLECSLGVWRLVLVSQTVNDGHEQLHRVSAFKEAGQMLLHQLIRGTSVDRAVAGIHRSGRWSPNVNIVCCRAQWLRGRALNSRLREPRFESCAAVLKPWEFFSLHCSSSFSCINEYLAIDSGGYVYEQPSCINCSIWPDASQRSWDGVWVNRCVREVKCKALWTVLRTGYCAI